MLFSLGALHAALDPCERVDQRRRTRVSRWRAWRRASCTAGSCPRMPPQGGPCSQQRCRPPSSKTSRCTACLLHCVLGVRNCKCGCRLRSDTPTAFAHLFRQALGHTYGSALMSNGRDPAGGPDTLPLQLQHRHHIFVRCEPSGGAQPDCKAARHVVGDVQSRPRVAYCCTLLHCS